MRLLFFLLTFFFIIFFSCSIKEEFVDLKNPKTFEKNNIYFQYPGNWEAEKFAEVDAGDLGFITYVIKSERNNSFITLKHFNKKMDMDLKEFFEIYSKKRNKKFNLKQKNIEKSQRLIMKTMQEGLKDYFEKKIMGFLVPHISEYYIFHVNNQTFSIITQTPKEDSQNILKGFELFYKTLKIQKPNPEKKDD